MRRDLNSIGGGTSVTALDKHLDPDGSLKKAISGNVAGSVEAGSLSTPAAAEGDKPAVIPADGDAVAAAAAKADPDSPGDQTIQPPAKAGASTV